MSPEDVDDLFEPPDPPGPSPERLDAMRRAAALIAEQGDCSACRSTAASAVQNDVYFEMWNALTHASGCPGHALKFRLAARAALA